MKRFTVHFLEVGKKVITAGIGVIITVAIIEVVLILLSCVVGLFVSISNGVLAGLISGIATFVIGQSAIVLMIDFFPDRKND